MESFTEHRAVQATADTLVCEGKEIRVEIEMKDMI